MPDGKEVYFTANNKISCIKYADGQWQEADTAMFIADYMDGANCFEPFISPDGTKLLFTSNKESKGNNHNLWITERSGDTWGKPQMLSSAINSQAEGSWGEWHPCITHNGNIYFARDGNIYVSEYTKSKNKAAVKIASINSSSNDWDPYVEPNEKYMIFKSNRPGGYGKMDNYISYQNEDGSWTVPKNIGATYNTDLIDDAGDISPDGQYMFFSRTNETGEMDVYWVKANFIKDLNPTYSPE